MKTHTIKTPTAELLIIETPKGGYYSKDLHAIIAYGIMHNILEGYTLLGKPDEIREEDAMELVERIGEGDPCYQGDWFVNYQDDEYMFETAKESLLSLLESEIYWKNPIPTPEIQGGYDEFGNLHGGLDDNWISEFEEAEQKTFDRNRSLIFKKNK